MAEYRKHSGGSGWSDNRTAMRALLGAILFLPPLIVLVVVPSKRVRKPERFHQCSKMKAASWFLCAPDGDGNRRSIGLGCQADADGSLLGKMEKRPSKMKAAEFVSAPNGADGLI
jgi:hypothetical protein